MKKTLVLVSLVCLLFSSCKEETSEGKVYLTGADKQKTMEAGTLVIKKAGASNEGIIHINPSVKFQEMDGFGAAITGSACYNLLQMTPENRAALLKETFDPINGNGYSYIRISIGCSDFSLEDYTCCDTPGIENFAIHELDKRDLFPILKEILAINPNLKIMASPWTCPKWMKVNNLTELKPFDSWTSGQLNPKYYADYATYFVKFIKAMEAEGFTINSVTLQNEPLNRGNSASLFMTWQEQAEFIKTALGPNFEKEGITTKILAYDHNYDYDNHKEDCKDQVGYPEHIYADTAAAKYIDGAAYHAYGGDVSEMLRIHNLAPDKNLYFTEMSIGLWGDGYKFGSDLIWNMREVCIKSINNWNKAVIMWNYMLDDKHAPFRPGGCDICLGCIDIDSKNYTDLTKNSHYYTMAHLSKVVKPGAYRVENSGTAKDGIYYSTFVNPDQSIAVVMLNETETETTVKFEDGVKEVEYTIPAKSVASLVW